MSSEPDDPANLETYGGQPPDHSELPVLDEQLPNAPEALPNPPVSDVTAIPGIDEDPASVSSGSGLQSVIAVTGIHATAASDMPAALPANLSFAPLVAAPVVFCAATTSPSVLVDPMS